MLTAHQVAEYILSLSDPDEGDIISNLKLQKLLYYAQGFHLALYGDPLFPEKIVAWNLGPVVPEVYHEYKTYGSNHIPPPDDINFEIYSEEIRELLKDVYTIFGQFSAWRLRQMTHDEPPWRDTPSENVISLKRMKEYFVTQLADG